MKRANRIIRVAFNGGYIEAIQEQDHPERVWVVVKRIYLNLGLTEQRQMAKLKACGWAGTTIMVVPSPGGPQETFCIDLESLPMWLATIRASKVKPEAREALIIYQKRCKQALAEHFWPGLAGRRHQPEISAGQPTLASAAPAVKSLPSGEAAVEPIEEQAVRLAFGYSLDSDRIAKIAPQGLSDAELDRFLVQQTRNGSFVVGPLRVKYSPGGRLLLYVEDQPQTILQGTPLRALVRRVHGIPVRQGGPSARLPLPPRVLARTDACTICPAEGARVHQSITPSLSVPQRVGYLQDIRPAGRQAADRKRAHRAAGAAELAQGATVASCDLPHSPHPKAGRICCSTRERAR